MRKIGIVFSIILIVFLTFDYILLKHDHNKSPGEVSSGKITSKYNKELFEGSWYSSRAAANINIYLNGSWEMKKYSGNWSLQDDYFVWTYDNSPYNSYGKLDKNYIVSLNSHQIIFRELDGSTTIFKRLK